MTIQELFISYLNDRSISYNQLQSDVLHFSYIKLDFLFQVDNRDNNYFRIILPNLLGITDSNKERIRDYISIVNPGLKVGKLVEVNNTLWLTAEALVFSIVDINILFQRVINMLLEFYEKIKNELPKRVNDEKID